MATGLELSVLVGMIYDAAESPALWPVFLEHYGKTIRADRTFIQIHRFDEGSSQIVHAWGLDGAIRGSDHYSPPDVWRDYGPSKYVQGHVLADTVTYPRSLLVKSDFYNDGLVPADGGHGLAGVIAREPNGTLTLAALRDERSHEWDGGDSQLAESLLPHVTRARAIQERLELLRAAALVLDTVDVGIVFLTGGGEVIRCNRPAEQIIEADDGLCVRNARLQATDPAADAPLQRALQAAVSAGPSLTCEAAVAVPRGSAKRPYQVMTARPNNPPPLFSGMRSPEVVALIVDPESQRPAAIDLLVRIYGLTPREAALASALSTGKTVEQAGEELRMTYETARSHLRRIFGKTNTSRQAELMMLLARLPKA
jgi:DNA-binding CsgD family transcriptional regulator